MQYAEYPQDFMVLLEIKSQKGGQDNMEKWLGYKKIKRIGQMPVRLFADDDKDGVANVFDCRPKNRRKQDVISPYSGANPMQEMYNRQEVSRQMKEQEKLYRDAQRIEEARNFELARLSSTPSTMVYGFDFPEQNKWITPQSLISAPKRTGSGKTIGFVAQAQQKKQQQYDEAKEVAAARARAATRAPTITVPPIKIVLKQTKLSPWNKIQNIFRGGSGGR